MSTKIYNGLRATDKNPFTVQRRIKEVLEPLFFAKFDEALKKAVSETGRPWETVFEMFPGTKPEPIPEGRFMIADTLYGLIESLYKSTSHTFSPLDFGYEAVLLPNGLGIAREPLVLVFAEHGGEEYRKALVDAGVVEQYGYWDNSDRPKSVNADEWVERRKAWDKLETPRKDGMFIMMPGRLDTAWSDRG